MLLLILRVVKQSICIFEFLVFTLFLYALSWIPRRFTESFYHRLFLLWCKSFVYALNIDLKKHEKHLRPLPDHYILVANHPSAFEDIGIPALFNVYPLAKWGVKYWFLVGRISEAAGTVYVKRDDPDSRHDAGDALKKLLLSGKNVSLFPEGGCKGKRIYERFEYGAFSLSLQTGVPIVPVFLHYEMQELFEWRDPQTLIDKMRHFMTCQNNRANYYVYDPIYPEQFDNKQQYSDYVHNLYLQWQHRYLE